MLFGHYKVTKNIANFLIIRQLFSVYFRRTHVKIRKEKFFLLLRQYEEEMLDAFLQDDDYFSELLQYCNILYEMLPTILGSSHLRAEKDTRKLAAIALVAAGYAGDMPEELANELLDDIDYHFNKVKCRKIEGMMPQLMKMVESEMEGMKR